MQVKHWAPSDALRDFLSQCGDPPIYVGWGSMIAGTLERMLELALRAMMASGRRGILFSGWAKLDPSLLGDDVAGVADLRKYAETSVFVVDNAPHEWEIELEQHAKPASLGPPSITSFPRLPGGSSRAAA
jgi:UDP:flavonoid glycosyltransferase YjiC (YdhE family)